MIQSFKDGNTAQLFTERKNARWAAVRTVALRKLDQLEASVNLLDLSIPPGNRLEPLRGDRRGQHSIRINDQYRICFIWKTDARMK
jgi:proteic killer suppression protein